MTKPNSLPRVRLESLPTPLQELPNLTKLLKGPRIRVKRDELTGLTFRGKDKEIRVPNRRHPSGGRALSPHF